MDRLNLQKSIGKIEMCKYFGEKKLQDGKIVAYKQFSSTLRQGEKIPAP